MQGLLEALALERDLPVLAIVAADMPFAGSVLPTLIAELAATGPAVDAVIPVDDQEHEQPLAGAYRAAALSRALADLGRPEGRSVRDLRAGLSVRTRRIDDTVTLMDVDTPDDLLTFERVDFGGLKAALDDDPERIVIDLQNARLAMRKPLPGGQGPVTSVRSGPQDDGGLRIVLDP